MRVGGGAVGVYGGDRGDVVHLGFEEDRMVRDLFLPTSFPGVRSVAERRATVAQQFTAGFRMHIAAESPVGTDDLWCMFSRPSGTS